MRILLAILLSFLILAPRLRADCRVGAHAESITPITWPVSLAGSMADQIATRAHDPIHARAAVLDDGEHRIAFVVCDSCMILRETIDAAKAKIAATTKIPADHVMISATHAHSCPTSAQVFQSDPDPAYRDFLTDKIAVAVQQAVDNLTPAEVGIGKGTCASEVFNRRWHMNPGTISPDPFGNTHDSVQMNPPLESPNLLEPAGPIDPDVYLLAARSPDHKPILFFANYSLHYVGGVPGGEVSADYFGAFCRIIEEKVGGTALLSNGTSGDINNINFKQKRGDLAPFGQIKHVASVVANEALATYAKLPFTKDTTLAATTRELEIGVRKPTLDDVQKAKDILANTSAGPLRTLPEIYARETVKLAEYPDQVRLIVQGIRVGNALVIALPCEVFAEIGLEIKSKSPFPSTFVVELANGYNGYLPTPKQHEWGGYETWRARSSYLAADASPKIVAAALDIAQSLARRSNP